MRLLAITPPSVITPVIDVGVVEAWLEAGAREHGIAVLLREPGADAAAIVADPRLQPLRAALGEHGIPALLSLDPRTCDPDATRELIARADPPIAGIQLRGDPSPALAARYRAALGTARVLGRSVHGEVPGLQPPSTGGPELFDYSCLAPIFDARTSLPGHAKHGIGLAALRSWAAVCPNIIALGGVTPETAQACLDAGAVGLAGIRLFFGPVAEARQDVAALGRALSRRASTDHGQA